MSESALDLAGEADPDGLFYLAGGPASRTLPIAAALVRDERGRVLAASTRAHGRPVPTLLIEVEAPPALASAR